ncbi:LysR family transcriptional regulator [Hahella sp. KA22]|uniref:LysR family transcriptional regulator n=1 Tax=Hahella sp. KA22 TaxID=1628392 RepID=UPI000FDCF71C|nr:LysR family transcriptional regulator [Hahella sp. KA22]AZZ92041.1 LysR family transcriptional regulator [Hahella sp. KA22]QAY55412.1 LysR family transcriptional regulator [Hahella sp. KA22]
MIDDLRALAVFAKTVEAGSFRAAASALSLSPSVVSHHISGLETRLGVALLYRSTRRLSLTSEGERLFDHAKTMLAAAEAGLNAIAEQAAEPTGRLSITAPAVLARGPFTEDVAAFALAYPRVSLCINYSDIRQDLIRDGIDLAIRIGAMPDSALKSKKLFDLTRRLVASPHYLQSRATPSKPEDLLDWEWIGLKMRPNHKLLYNAAGECHRIDYSPRITVDSIDAVCQLAAAGLGLATPPAFLVEEDLRVGRLCDPLPGWNVDALGVYALWPPNAARESLTYRFIQFLQERRQADANTV